VHGLHVELFLSLNLHEPHILLGHRFGDGFGIEEVVLVRLAVGLDELSRNELGTHYRHQVIRLPVGLLFRLLLSLADLGGTYFKSFAVVAVEKWKAVCAFQAQRLFHGQD
jgi:hypothetical protein